MSLFNFVWDIDQDGKIHTLTNEIDQLKQRINVLEQWIQHYNDRQPNQPDIQPHAAKMAGSP